MSLKIHNISIIIRAGNSEPYIGFAIQSVIDHILNPEIIVINNNMDKETMDIVTDFSFTNIKIIDLEHYSPGKALNLGVKSANNKYVLFLSAHCQIISQEASVIHWLDEGKVAVFGKQIPINKGKRITPRYLWKNFGDKPVVNMWSNGEDRPFLHFAYCFFERQFLLEFPLNEELKGKEDRYWAQQMIDGGYSYYYNPDLICNHFFTDGGSTWTKND